jgi:hypothetical protein
MKNIEGIKLPGEEARVRRNYTKKKQKLKNI